MILFMKDFTEIRSFNNDIADVITDQEIKSTQIDYTSWSEQSKIKDQRYLLHFKYYIKSLIHRSAWRTGVWFQSYLQNWLWKAV